MDRLDAMATFLAAVDGGSLSAASRSLRMPLATVSRKVSELEAHLRTQLLVRTSRRLSLTEAGKAYVDACRRILEDVQDAERAVAGEYRAPQGHLTITSPIMFGRLHVQPVLLDFLNAYPDVSARMILTDDVLSLVDNHVDAAIRIGALADSAMRATRLGAVARVACASPAYLAAHGAPQTPSDLRNHQCIAFDGLYSGAIWEFRNGKAAIKHEVRPRYVVNSADGAIDAAIASAGITRILSYQIGPAVAAGALLPILRDFEPEPLPIHVGHGNLALLPLKLRAFIDFVAPRLRASIPVL